MAQPSSFQSRTPFSLHTGVDLSATPSGTLIFECPNGDVEVHFCIFYSKCQLIYEACDGLNNNNNTNLRLKVAYPADLVHDCALALYGEKKKYYPEMYRFFDFLLVIPEYLSIEKYKGDYTSVPALYRKHIQKDIQKCYENGYKFYCHPDIDCKTLLLIFEDGEYAEVFIEKIFAAVLRDALNTTDPKKYYNEKIKEISRSFGLYEYQNFMYGIFGEEEEPAYLAIGDNCYDRIGSFDDNTGGFKCVAKIPGTKDVIYINNYTIAKELRKYDWVEFKEFGTTKGKYFDEVYGFMSPSKMKNISSKNQPLAPARRKVAKKLQPIDDDEDSENKDPVVIIGDPLRRIIMNEQAIEEDEEENPHGYH
jgi:hypothetical protein